MITVIIPAYNHVQYIEECIGSVFAQDYPLIDLIVIDDGSTDGTKEVVEKIFNRDFTRFRFISRENRGLIATLNEGIKLARGNFICELASDDVLLPDSFAKRVAYLEKNPEIGVVFADAYQMFENKKTQQRLNNNGKSYRSAAHSILDLIHGKVKILFATGLFRKEVMTNIGGFDEDFRYFEDIAMQFKLSHYTQVGFLDEPVMYYRKHGSNTSSSQKLSVRREKVLALEKLLDSKTYSNDSEIKEALFQEYRRYLKFAIRHVVDPEEYAAIFEKARRLHPLSLKMLYYRMIGPREESA